MRRARLTATLLMALAAFVLVDVADAKPGGATGAATGAASASASSGATQAAAAEGSAPGAGPPNHARADAAPRGPPESSPGHGRSDDAAPAHGRHKGQADASEGISGGHDASDDANAGPRAGGGSPSADQQPATAADASAPPATVEVLLAWTWPTAVLAPTPGGLDAGGSYAEGSTIVAYRFTIDGERGAWQESSRFDATALPAGLYTVRVEVRDAHGHVASATATYHVASAPAQAVPVPWWLGLLALAGARPR